MERRSSCTSRGTLGLICQNPFSNVTARYARGSQLSGRQLRRRNAAADLELASNGCRPLDTGFLSRRITVHNNKGLPRTDVGSVRQKPAKSRSPLQGMYEVGLWKGWGISLEIGKRTEEKHMLKRVRVRHPRSDRVTPRSETC